MPRIFRHLAALVCLCFSWTSTATAIDLAEARAAVDAARSEAVEASEPLTAALFDLVPKVDGWTCRREAASDRLIAIGALPLARMRCESGTQVLRVNLIYDPDAAAFLCDMAERDGHAHTDGDDVTGNSRIHSGAHGQLFRLLVDVRGCLGTKVAVFLSGSRTRAALDEGPAAIDAFAAALVSVDPARLPNASLVRYDAAADALIAALDDTSRAFEALLPRPDGAEIATRSLTSATAPFPHSARSSLFAEAPSASAEIGARGCRVLIRLSAGPEQRHLAVRVRKWAREGLVEGKVTHAFRQRNTEQFRGAERIDGTGLRLLVGDWLIVTVEIPGNTPCERDPDIVTSLFLNIMAVLDG